MRMQVEHAAHCYTMNQRINGIILIGFFDAQGNPAGFVTPQSSLTECGVPGYHFGVLVVKNKIDWISQRPAVINI
jgi:hypothetical protein